MENKNAELFSPIQISRMEVKNRVILPALILNFPIDGVRIGDEWHRFYHKRAEGGVGLMIVGACYVHAAGRQDEFQIGVDRDEWIPELERIAQTIKKGGSQPALQLNHAGRYSLKKVTGMDPVSSSAIASRYTRETPRALTTSEVEEIIECFAKAAWRAREAGFEAVELLGATGYLISQFLSPLTNHREDRFGGDFEGRITFVKEIIAAIKSEVGNDFPLIFRLSSKDNIPGGLDADDQRHLAGKLSEWGVHLINVTAGWHDAGVPQIISSVPQGYFVPYAERIKEEVEVPVSCAVRITSPDYAREVVAGGKIDMVTLGRALIADPDWPRKAEAGDDDAIRHCICCCHCFDRAFARISTECSVNANLDGLEPQPMQEPKRLLVVGGGPAGMEAARVMASRGNKVVLQEKADKLGGKIALAAVPPHKEDMASLARYQIHEIEHSSVEVRLRDPFKGDNGAFDGIIFAAGGEERRIEIEGMDAIPCFTAGQVLRGDVDVESPVIIIGAGIVGGETADFLVDKGMKVSLVEILETPLADMGMSVRWVLLSRLKKQGVHIYTSSEVVEVHEGGVRVQTPEGEKNMDAKSIVFAVGSEPDSDLLEKIDAIQIPHCVIGDSKKPRKIKDAVHEGYWAATSWVDSLE